MQHAACSFTKIIFQINKRLSTILASQLLVASVALAQSQFTGKVVSQEDGEPVIGASVRVAGTKVGTVTYALKARVHAHGQLSRRRGGSQEGYQHQGQGRRHRHRHGSQQRDIPNSGKRNQRRIHERPEYRMGRWPTCTRLSQEICKWITRGKDSTSSLPLVFRRLIIMYLYQNQTFFINFAKNKITYARVSFGFHNLLCWQPCRPT